MPQEREHIRHVTDVYRNLIEAVGICLRRGYQGKKERDACSVSYQQQLRVARDSLEEARNCSGNDEETLPELNVIRALLDMYEKRCGKCERRNLSETDRFLARLGLI